MFFFCALFAKQLIIIGWHVSYKVYLFIDGYRTVECISNANGNQSTHRLIIVSSFYPNKTRIGNKVSARKTIFCARWKRNFHPALDGTFLTNAAQRNRLLSRVRISKHKTICCCRSNFCRIGVGSVKSSESKIDRKSISSSIYLGETSDKGEQAKSFVPLNSILWFRHCFRRASDHAKADFLRFPSKFSFVDVSFNQEKSWSSERKCLWESCLNVLDAELDILMLIA